MVKEGKGEGGFGGGGGEDQVSVPANKIGVVIGNRCRSFPGNFITPKSSCRSPELTYPEIDLLW